MLKKSKTAIILSKMTLKSAGYCAITTWLI